MSNGRDGFAGSMGALMALVGSAVGLGNLWRFPYLMGNNGGAAFIIIYIAFVILLCVPIMLAEFSIGRRSQINAFSAMRSLAPGSKWGLIGVLFVLVAVLILSFYSVVGGWTMDYLFQSITFNLPEQTKAADTFSLCTSSTFRPLIFTSVFVILSSIILIAGVKDGIEKVAKIMMPLLFVIIIALAIKSSLLPGASKGLSFLLRPDFSAVNAQTILAALGQAFFSLSIGMGAIMTYGSYVRRSANILSITTATALADTLFALLAGLVIMPAVFAFGMSASEGPGLLFIVLPEVFSVFTGGGLFAILFFFAVFLAAISSAFSLLEVIVAYLSEELKISRRLSIFIASSVCLFLAVLCSLSQGALSEFKILGFTFFDLFDTLTANLLMPIGALLMVVFVGWKMRKPDFVDEITSAGKVRVKPIIYNTIYFIIKYIAPLAIITIMICGWL